MVLRRIKDRSRHRFNLAIAEVGDNELWQRAQIGFAVVANDRRFVESLVDRVLGFIESMAVAKVIADEKDFLVYGEESGPGAFAPEDDDGEPAGE